MKDIEKLYLAAKSSGSPKDVSAYESAIQELLENNPGGYMSNVEYIISSDIGLSTWNKFIEKYGLPIALYDDMISLFEKCSEKAEKSGNKKMKKSCDSIKDELACYKESYKMLFNMFDYYQEKATDEYPAMYYGLTNGYQNSRLLNGMFTAYGEAAIPDALLTAEKYGGKAVSTILSYIEQTSFEKTEILCEWLVEGVNEVFMANTIPQDVQSHLDIMKENSVSAKVEKIRSKHNEQMRESVITGEESSYLYTEADLDMISDYISYKEYLVTCTENQKIAKQLLDDIYSLYEEFDGLINEDDSIAMYSEGVDGTVTMLTEEAAADLSRWLPPANGGYNQYPALGQEDPYHKHHKSISNLVNDIGTPKTESVIEESKRIVNTRNKYTGQAPSYLSNNHDLSWGEDKDKPKEEDPNDIESYRRPSADKNPETVETDPEPVDDPDEDFTPEEKKQQQAVNNYYYYTYTNSMNKNSNSFNKDSSTHDDHSTETKTTNIHDDHSSNKRIRSDNINSGDDKDEKTESAKPWELNFDPTDVKPIREAYTMKFLPLTEEEKNKLLANIRNTEDSAKKILNPIFTKYPAYGLTFSLLGHDMSYEQLESELAEYGKRANSPYAVILDHEGIYINDDIEFSVDGFDQRDFIMELEHDHPEEIERLKALGKYNTDDRRDWSEIHWGEKILGYDKSLTEICEDITNIVRDNFKMVNNFEYVGDNDSGPVYTGKIRNEYWFDGIDLSTPRMVFATVESTITEATGDADDQKPESDHPVQDTMRDIDRTLNKYQQGAKKKVQTVVNAGQTFMKPIRRTHQWVTKLAADWKDKDETKIKEDLADPHARRNLFSAIGWAIKTGSFLKAGLLLNPVFIFLTATRKIGKNKKEFRLRNEMIGELKTELKIIDEKISDADRAGDNAAKYKLYRLKNEINKKLMRVGGAYTRSWKRML